MTSIECAFLRLHSFCIPCSIRVYCLVSQIKTLLITRLAVSMTSDIYGLEFNEYLSIVESLHFRGIYTMRKSLCFETISFLQSTALLQKQQNIIRVPCKPCLDRRTQRNRNLATVGGVGSAVIQTPNLVMQTHRRTLNSASTVGETSRDPNSFQ